MLSRRGFIARVGSSTAIAVATVAGASGYGVAGTMPSLTVYKSPECGCCIAWADHMRANGFRVTIHDRDDLDAFKQQRGVPESLQACHTAIVAGYTIEGHVPAADVKMLLEMSPEAYGLAVPGMPVGSPGMEMGQRKDPYAVMIFGKKGRALFSRH